MLKIKDIGLWLLSLSLLGCAADKNSNYNTLFNSLINATQLTEATNRKELPRLSTTLIDERTSCPVAACRTTLVPLAIAERMIARC